MDLTSMAGRLRRLDPRLAGVAERLVARVPALRRRIDEEEDSLLAGLEPQVKPYRERERHVRLPATGRPRAEVLGTIAKMSRAERRGWHEGFASGAVYHGDDEHVAFLNEVYALTSQTNPLHADLWPSGAMFEAEVVAMTASMLGGDEKVCGTVTSGGTESILLAMKTYRDRARARRRGGTFQIVAPSSAHVAFDKAGEWLGLRVVRVPLGPDLRADVGAMRRAVTRDTVAMIGSAPGFPHGLIDPIEELAAFARSRGIGFHTDACLGGFVLPWARRLGREVPAFDFSVPGVTSMSTDTHKFGYAAKGTSVVLYRDRELRAHQYFTATEWPGGLYFSPTLAGSRPGALSAAAWAAMVATGEDGYLEATRKVLEAADTIKAGVRSIPELRPLGDPLFVIAFASDAIDVYRVLDAMGRRGWSLTGLQKPPAVHICVTLRHAEPGVADRFVEDLRASVGEVRTHPPSGEGMAPIYGLAGTIPFRGMVGDLLRKYLDMLYRP